MDTPASPSFKALYEQYIDAFNAHSWKDVKACLSPDVEIYVRGRLDVKDNWEQLKKNYHDHWALPNCRVTIPRLVEFDRGVDVTVIDHARSKSVEIRYTYAFQDGKWLQVKHEIGAVTNVAEDFDTKAETTASV